ncbi:MAG: LacI family DNA-binding transcriptional regulator [Roseomonas sp.]|nr:LacI family DNA-binding transcriptional regulator [Roseomonas sp.]
MHDEMKRRNVTSLHVAAAAGVSQSAVSRAFRDGASISADMRERVHAAARRLGYTPNAFASGLLTRSSGLVGLVMGDVSNPVQSALLAALLPRLAAAGRPPLLASAADAAGLRRALDRLERYRPDAVLICAPTLPPALGARLARDGVPLVLVNRYPLRPGPAVARTDNLAGGAEMARHLQSRGLRRVAVIGGPAEAPASRERLAGFASVLRPVAAATGDYSLASGALALRRLLRHAPDAVFCANDLMALGAMDAAPAGLPVFGFDGIPEGALAKYRLTTMAQDIEGLAEAALSLLDQPGEQRLVPARLLVRQEKD